MCGCGHHIELMAAPNLRGKARGQDPNIVRSV
jgi:hypothetical protein